MRRALPIAALTLACGAAPSGADAPPASLASAEPEPAPKAAAQVIERAPVQRFASAEEMVGKHVLVGAGTELRLAPGPDAPTLRLRKAEENAPFAYAFAVVAQADGLLMLERAEPEARCDPGLAGLDVDGARFWLAPASVAPVLARESETRFDDGTWVRLRTGTAIVQDGAQGLADVGGMRVHASIDPRDVGNAFTPAVANAPESTPDSVAREATIRYGTYQLADPGERLHRNALGRPYVLGRSKSGDDELVDLVASCASVRGRVTGAALSDADSMPRTGVVPSAYGAAMGESWSVVAGARASWADGTPAGKLTMNRRWSTRGKSKKHLRCFPIGDDGSAFEAIELCFAAKDVVHEDPMGVLGVLGSAPSASVFGELGTGTLGGLGEWSDEPGIGSRGLIELGGEEAGAFGGAGDFGGLDVAPKPTIDVRVATLSSTGVRDGKVVRKRVVSLRRCAMASDPPASGTLTVAFTIGKDGTTRDVEVSGIDDIVACARAAIEGWTFGRGGEATISAELQLAPKAP